MRNTNHASNAQQGTSLPELMVGLLVGLIATAAILHTFAVSEGRKRNTTGAAEAQQTGWIAMFTVADELASAGAGIAAATSELGTCPDTGDIRTTSRPVPVLITAGTTPDAPDSVTVIHGSANAHAFPVPFAAAAPAGSGYHVQSPFGFAANDMIVAVSLTGNCAASIVTSVSQPDEEGVVDIAHSGASNTYPASSVLLNLGPRSRVARLRYDIVEATLRSLDLVSAGAAPNPLASDIVNMKAQYGIDSDNDGFLDTWVSAASAPWRPADVLAAPAAALLGIKAVRIGLIVRSETYDRDVTRPFNWTLFDCPQADKTRCPGRITGTLPSGWRYRIYERVIPLRNQIWNGHP